MISNRNTTRSLFQGGFIGWLRGLIGEVHPSPGTVVGSWVAGSGRGAYMVASVEGDFISATGKGSWISGSVEGDFSSANGRGSAIFLVEG